MKKKSCFISYMLLYDADCLRLRYDAGGGGQ